MVRLKLYKLLNRQTGMENNEDAFACLACGFVGDAEKFIKSADGTVRKICKECMAAFVKYRNYAFLEQYLTPKNTPNIAEEKDPKIRLALIKRSAARVKQLHIKANKQGWKD